MWVSFSFHLLAHYTKPCNILMYVYKFSNIWPRMWFVFDTELEKHSKPQLSITSWASKPICHKLGYFTGLVLFLSSHMTKDRFFIKVLGKEIYFENYPFFLFFMVWKDSISVTNYDEMVIGSISLTIIVFCTNRHALQNKHLVRFQCGTATVNAVHLRD